MNYTTTLEPSSSSSSSSAAFPPPPTQGLKRIVSLSYEDYYNYNNDERLQGSRISTSDNHNNGNKRRRYMRRGSRCPSMFTTAILPDCIFNDDEDDTNQPSSNTKNKTMTTTKGVDNEYGVYDSSSRIPMMATTLPKCLTRLPTACCTSPLVHNDDEDKEEDKVSHDTMGGKPEEQDHQHSLSSGLSILREALTLSDKQLIDDEDEDDDDDTDEDDDALIRSAIRLLNQQ